MVLHLYILRYDLQIIQNSIIHMPKPRDEEAETSTHEATTALEEDGCKLLLCHMSIVFNHVSKSVLFVFLYLSRKKMLKIQFPLYNYTSKKPKSLFWRPFNVFISKENETFSPSKCIYLERKCSKFNFLFIIIHRKNQKVYFRMHF